MPPKKKKKEGPRRSGGKRPRQSGGKRPRQSGGKRPRQSGGKRPRQSGGERSNRNIFIVNRNPFPLPPYVSPFVAVPSPPAPSFPEPDCDHKVGGMCMSEKEINEAIQAEAQHLIAQQASAPQQPPTESAPPRHVSADGVLSATPRSETD